MSQRQDQRATEGSIAIQSAGDTTINGGMTPDQMQQIIETVAAQVPVYAAIARELVDIRLKDFEERILNRFEGDGSTRKEAFKDPDFQYLLGKAQHAFARSGKDEVGSILADLIAERSKVEKRDRLALTLNQAVEIAATLTVNEYAELAFCYLFSRTRATNVVNLSALYKMLNDRINPFIDNISSSQASYGYIEAQRCANVGMMVSNFRDLLILNYAGLLMHGLQADVVKTSFPTVDLSNKLLFIQCINNNNNIQVNAISKDVWDQSTSSILFSENDRDAIWSRFADTLMSKEEMIASFSAHVPRIADAFHLWDSTPLHSLQLTTIGIAIGHAFASNHGFEAPLAIWIN